MPFNLQKKLNNRVGEFSTSRKIQIFLYGGSQGSINLNNFLIKLLKKLPKKYINNIKIIIQSPIIQKKYIEKELNSIGIENNIQDFYSNISTLLNSSDIVVARSGAGTINDIILSQTPSILVW